MNIPLLDIINRLGIEALVPLTIMGAVLLIFLVRNEVAGLMFFLTAAAAFIGSATTMIADMASLVRWIIVVLVPLPNVIFGKRLKVSFGMLLFWGYVLCGFVSLLNAREPVWQMQRGVLLLAVAIALPLAYSSRSYSVFRASLRAIALAAALFAIVNFGALPGGLTSAARFSGYSTRAPNFTLTLGALLPFMYWALWEDRSKAIKLICGAGFLLGAIMLVFSGQRTGALGGLIGVLPLAVATVGSKRAAAMKWPILVFVALAAGGYLIYQASSPDRMAFLLNRYSLSAGLSNRDLLWKEAIRQIGLSPILGYGVGAAEMLISSSFHNAYLEVWYNTGIMGLFFFVAAQGYFFYRIFVLAGQYREPQIRMVLALAFGYMLAIVLMSMVESVGAQASGLNVLLYLFLGILVCDEQVFSSFAEGTGTVGMRGIPTHEAVREQAS